jgi:glycosyl transferase family 87
MDWFKMTGLNNGHAHESGLKPYRRDPVLWAILAGFFAAYLLLFIFPVFLNDAHMMRFFKYVPTLQRAEMIGEDARGLHDFSQAWAAGEDPYSVNWIAYPPVTLLLFYPLSLVTPFNAYVIMLVLGILCFVGIGLWFPLSLYRNLSPIILLFFATGLISYGLQFELERGQFNVIAMFLCFTAIHLFHRHPENRPLRYLAYFLFTVSVQLKIYPAIFAVLLIGDWAAWQHNLKRLAALAVLNLGLLFALGYGLFLDFKDSLLSQITTFSPSATNHSIASFAYSLTDLAGSSKLNAYLPQVSVLLRDHPAWIQWILLAIFVASFGVGLGLVLKSGSFRLAPHLLLACTIGALVIPAVSNDYTLPILAAPVAIFMEHASINLSVAAPADQKAAVNRLRIFLVVVISTAYAWTLFSYTNKPDLGLLNNNFPPLLVILLASLAFTLLTGWNAAPTAPAGRIGEAPPDPGQQPAPAPP